MTKQYDAKTVPQLLEKRCNSPAGKVILAAIMLILYSVYLVPIFKGCASLFSGRIGVTYIQGLVIALAIMAIYYAVGGLPAIIWMASCRGILMLGGAVLLLYAGLLNAGGGINGICENIPAAVTSMSGDRVPGKRALAWPFHLLGTTGPARSTDNDLVRQGPAGGALCRPLWPVSIASMRFASSPWKYWPMRARCESAGYLPQESPMAWCPSWPRPICLRALTA